MFHTVCQRNEVELNWIGKIPETIQSNLTCDVWCYVYKVKSYPIFIHTLIITICNLLFTMTALVEKTQLCRNAFLVVIVVIVY